MRTRTNPTEVRSGAPRAGHWARRRLTKLAVAVSALATVVVPALAVSGSAQAGSPLGQQLTSGLSSLAGLVPALPTNATQQAAPFALPVLAPPAQRPGAPTAVTVVQNWTLPDVVVFWKNPVGGVPATGAVVQLDQVLGTILEPVTQIACGSCTTATLRGLSFGSTYAAKVITTSASGLGAAASSAPITLSTSCTAGACVSFNTTQSIASANAPYSGVLDSLYPVASDQQVGSTLRMSLFRGAPIPLTATTYDWSSFNVATADGAQTIVNLGDEWLSHYGNNPPLPWSNWALYSAFITTTVKNMVASGHPVTYWEVYNEPGGNDADLGPAAFDTETPQLLLQEFLVAYQAIKAADPSAQIVGPDLPFWTDYPGQWGPTYHGYDMATFLAFAAANKLQLAALTWHEIIDIKGTTPEDNTLSPINIINHVAEARALLAQYPSLGHPQIIIDEYGMPEVQKIPGWDVEYLAALTDAGVSLASRACWDDDCALPDLDGLLLINGQSPSPDYYDRLIYASMTGNMVATTSTSDTVSLLGSYNSPSGTFVGLIGRGVGCTQNLFMCPFGFPDAADAGVDAVQVTVTVPWSAGSTNVVLTDVSGELPSLGATPPTSQSFQETITPSGANKGTITFAIPQFRDGDAYGVKVTHIAS